MVPRTRLVLIALILSAWGAAPVAQTTARTPPLRGMLVRAAAYVQQFEADFALVISDEKYEQFLTVEAPGTRLRPVQRATRVMRSEMLFIWLPHEQLWLTTRHALVVDGKPVAESGGQLATAMAAGDQERRAHLGRIRSESARYNLGTIRRNFSDPTFALQFLSGRLQPRFDWRLKGGDTVDGIDTWRIDFQERARPSLIRGEGVDLPSTGTVWIDAASNAVLKTALSVTDRGRRTLGRMDVHYRYEPRLSLWVPARMSETYAQFRSITGEERVTCEATYSNYRRFETAVRVIPP